jgi:hypothetical protein
MIWSWSIRVIEADLTVASYGFALTSVRGNSRVKRSLDGHRAESAQGGMVHGERVSDGCTDCKVSGVSGTPAKAPDNEIRKREKNLFAAGEINILICRDQ